MTDISRQDAYDAYDAGKKAFAEGKPFRDNPYASYTPQFWGWADGWVQAEYNSEDSITDRTATTHQDTPSA